MFKQFVHQLTYPLHRTLRAVLLYITIRSIDYKHGLSGVAWSGSASDHLVGHSTVYIGIKDYNRVIT